MPLFTHDTLPSSSADAIEEFNENYLAAVGAAVPPGWAVDYGALIPTQSTLVKFPLSLASMKYQATDGKGSRFKGMAEREFSIKPSEFDAGYEAPLIELLKNTFAYRKWTMQAELFAKAEGRHRNRTIAPMLEANTELCGWDGLALFHDAHLANPSEPDLGTFDNLQATTKDVVSAANLEAEITAMMEVKDENGEKLGVMPDTVLVGTADYQPLVNFLKQDIIASGAGTATVRNPYFGGVLQVVHVPELTDANDWYLVDSKLLSALPPWILLKLDPGADLGLRFFDESSDYFKHSGKIAVSSHIWYGSGFAFPHAIRKVAGA